MIVPTFLEVAQDILQEGYGVHLHTRGVSMAPLIRGGCVLLVEQAALEDLRLGDILVYRDRDLLVAHRLVARRRRQGSLCLLTKGDAFSWRFREEIDPEQVLGRVTVVRGRRGREIKIGAGWGRLLSLALVAAWPLPQGLFLVLARLKAAWARQRRAGADPKD